MELYSVLLAIVSASLLLLRHLVTRSSKTRDSGSKQPPSPWALPIVGHMHHLIMGAASPHRTLRDLATKHGPVLHLKLGEVDHVVISSAEAAREIMKTHDLNFASRPLFLFGTIVAYGNQDILFAPYGSYWRQIRKVCVTELLSSARVKSFRPIREEAMDALVRDISVTKLGLPVNLSEKLLLATTGMVTRAAFGKECRHGQRFLSAVREVLVQLSGSSLADLYPSCSFIATLTGARSKLERVHRELDGILSEIIVEHQAMKQESADLVDVLLRLMDHGLDFTLTMTSIKAVIFDIFLGGVETTLTTLEWAMSELMRHPEAMRKAQAEVRRAVGGKGRVEEGDIEGFRYMKHVINETLRLYPPAPLLLPRLCSEAAVVGGYRIRAGTRVLVNAWAIERDGTYWEEAERFWPERFEGSSVELRAARFEFLPFGGGRRICPGIRFAMAGLELTLARLLFHFDWELPDGMKPEELDMTEHFKTSVTRKYDLFLLATPVTSVNSTASL